MCGLPKIDPIEIRMVHHVILALSAFLLFATAGCDSSMPDEFEPPAFTGVAGTING